MYTSTKPMQSAIPAEYINIFTSLVSNEQLTTTISIKNMRIKTLIGFILIGFQSLVDACPTKGNEETYFASFIHFASILQNRRFMSCVYRAIVVLSFAKMPNSIRIESCILFCHCAKRSTQLFNLIFLYTEPNTFYVSVALCKLSLLSVTLHKLAYFSLMGSGLHALYII